MRQHFTEVEAFGTFVFIALCFIFGVMKVCHQRDEISRLKEELRIRVILPSNIPCEDRNGKQHYGSKAEHARRNWNKAIARKEEERLVRPTTESREDLVWSVQGTESDGSSETGEEEGTGQESEVQEGTKQ